MGENVIPYDGGTTTGSHTCDCIERLPCGNIKHDQIDYKVDQCCSKIGGDDQDQYVGCGNGSRHYNILKFNRFFQAGCNIKYEQDLDKF